MNQDIEKVWRDEFEKEMNLNNHLFDHCSIDRYADGSYFYTETRIAWEFYLSACRKRNEEVGKYLKSNDWNNPDLLSPSERTMALAITKLKEELRMETEFINRIANNGLDVPVAVDLMRRARKVQAERKVGCGWKIAGVLE